ncbi:chlorophyll A/B binding protein of LHCII type 1-like protein, partial [Tanacetum coccineum]
MDTLSLVSKYLNGMEDLLDDGDSLEARKLTVGKKQGRAHPRAYSKPFTRFFLPCDMDGQDYGKYGRKMVKELHVEIHGFMFLVNFVVIGYANEGEHLVIFGRGFLVTSKSRVDFGIGEMRIDLTMLEEIKDIDVLLDALVENLEEVGSSNGDLVKMGKASRNKHHKVNKLTPPIQLKIEEIPPISTIAPPSPIYHPLTQKQKEKVKEVLDRKYKELEESKPILEVLENYMTYRKKLNEVLMGRARLSRDDYVEEVKMIIVEEGLPKKMCNQGNFALPMKVNGTIEMNALADTGESVSVLPYCLFMNLGLEDPKPYNSNLTMADNTQAKALGEVKNVRIQIGYQAYLVDFLILDILVDKELTLLLGRPFWRTCGAVIDMGHGTLCIDDGVIHHTYFPKLRAKAYLDNFAQEEEDDWLSCFEVGRDEDVNPKYGPVVPSFLDIKDDMERALAMEAYFNPFKNIIVFKKLIDFLDDARLIVWITNLILKATLGSYLNPLIANFEKRNKQGTIEYHLQQVKNANMKWRELPLVERHAYCERLSRLQGKGFRIPRVPSWTFFYDYNIKKTLKNKMKYEYLHDDGDVFVDYSWERALSIYGDVYPEWCLEFFLTMYFDKGVDRTKLMIEKCIWFRLCGVENVLTLLELVVLLGLYEEDELNHGLFAIHFTKLEVDGNQP